MKILIIEDDIMSAAVLEQLLAYQHEVKVSHSAQEAICLGVECKPDLIISDWDLDDELDGVTVCKKILESHKTNIIFVSGSSLERLQKVAENLAPLHILNKPIDMKMLTTLLSSIN